MVFYKSLKQVYILHTLLSLYTIPGKAMHLSTLVNGCLVQPLWLHSLTRPVDSNILSVEKSWIYMRGYLIVILVQCKFYFNVRNFNKRPQPNLHSSRSISEYLDKIQSWNTLTSELGMGMIPSRPSFLQRPGAK